jgi:uncharacterized protein (TIGR03083 family)
MVDAAAQRLAFLIESAPDAAARLKGSEWSVADLAAHVTTCTEGYRGYIEGRTEPFEDMSDVAGGSVARTNAQLLTDEPERDLNALTARLRSGAQELVRATNGRRGDDRVLWHGLEFDVRSVLAMTLGEHLLHGHDLARNLRARWPIDRHEALTVVSAAVKLLPLLSNPRTSAGVNATYDLRVRGGPRFTLRITDGIVHLDEPGGRVDCHISADPVAMLLVSYGRRSQWRPILTTRMFAWGRRPWIGLRLMSYLVSP